MRTPEETELRDEFAGLALSHLMCLHKFDSCLSTDIDVFYVPQRRRLAAHAYLMADEMLRARECDLSTYKD